MKNLTMTLLAACALLGAGSPAKAVTTVVAKSTATAAAPAPAPAAPAPAKPLGEWHRDCDADVARLCPGLSKAAEIACLDKNTPNLSAACRQIRAKNEKIWQEERREKRRGVKD